MQDAKLLDKVTNGSGFIAALDQSGGSTPKALKGYGIEEDAWGSEEEMFGLIHKMRSRVITSPAFSGEKVLGAILFERTMDGEVDGKPTPEALLDRGVAPFIKIDKGLEDEANGVQLMKPMPDLDALLTRAKGLGVIGTKERSVINLANREGIAAVVKQQFDVAQQVTAHGLVPIIEPEVNIKSAERAEADEILLDELTKALDALLTRAKGLGVIGTKERSVINLANREGIAAVVKQQFEVAQQVTAHGLVPIIEPEVNIKSAERAEADEILLDELTKALDALPGDDKVMLKLSIPAKAGLYDSLVDHPRVARVVALSGGFSRSEACTELAKNRGMIASFSRALLNDLRHQMDDAEFNGALGLAIDEIHAASVAQP